MISKSPTQPVSEPLSESAIVDHDRGAHSLVQQWLDEIQDHWPKTVKKLCSAEPAVLLDRRTLKQLRFGLGAGLLEQFNPLIDHVASANDEADALEQLVSVAESASATLKSRSSETDPSESTLLAGISMLLVATCLKSAAINGSDQSFERILRSCLSAIAAAEEATSPLLYQWLSIELPLRIAAELSALKPFRKEGKIAAQRFITHTREQMDSDGWPKAICLKPYTALTASWVRCIHFAAACDVKLDASFMAQMEWVGEQFVRLHGPKKRPLFSGHDSQPSKKSFVDFVLSATGDGRAFSAANESRLLKSSSDKSHNDVSQTEASCVSEWSKSAILKSSWRANSPLTGIDFSSVDCVLEIAAKTNLISGSCPIEVRDDGQPIDFGTAGFEVICEMIDEDVAYLELEILHDDYKFFRQLLLSKRDRFLFFADSIHKEGAGEIDYRLRLPLANGIDVIRENGTRELYLNKPEKGIQSLILPLALPEWSADRCRGRLSVEDNGSKREELCIEKIVELGSDGGALYCPLFIDLDPRRSRLKRTWRSLTVGESLNIVRPEVAAAFRVQVNEDQFVFYRALRSIGNRTFLGQNFSGDFYAAKFFRNGEVEELVEIH